MFGVCMCMHSIFKESRSHMCVCKCIRLHIFQVASPTYIHTLTHASTSEPTPEYFFMHIHTYIQSILMKRKRPCMKRKRPCQNELQISHDMISLFTHTYTHLMRMHTHTGSVMT